MIGMRVRTRSDVPKVIRKGRKGNITSLGHAAATVRLVAKRSIRRGKKPAPIGHAPHTQTKRLPSSILYAVEKEKGRALIGPSFQLIGRAGELHEKGKQFRGQQFDRRPFMFPALEKTQPRLPRHWGGSIQ